MFPSQTENYLGNGWLLAVVTSGKRWLIVSSGVLFADVKHLYLGELCAAMIFSAQNCLWMFICATRLAARLPAFAHLVIHIVLMRSKPKVLAIATPCVVPSWAIVKNPRRFWWRLAISQHPHKPMCIKMQDTGSRVDRKCSVPSTDCACGPQPTPMRTRGFVHLAPKVLKVCRRELDFLSSAPYRICRFVHKHFYASDLESALPTTIGAHFDFEVVR